MEPERSMVSLPAVARWMDRRRRREEESFIVVDGC
jgi:hypothetical protein